MGKKCTKCNKNKSFDSFRKRKIKSGFSLYSWCLNCEREYSRIFSKEHPRRGKYQATLGNLITGSRQRAKKRGLKHTINREQVEKMLVDQQWKCAITGIPITFDIDARYVGKRRCPPNRVSIDRIDNSGGYIIDNIQLVCDFVNRFRNYLELDDFIGFCIMVADNNRGPK